VNSSLVVSLAQPSPSCRHIAERGELPHFSVKPDSVSRGMRLRQPEGCWVLIAMFVLRTNEFPWTDRHRLAKEGRRRPPPCTLWTRRRLSFGNPL
jgi:hypothetical protein